MGRLADPPVPPPPLPGWPLTGHDPREGRGVDGCIVTGASLHRVPLAFKTVLSSAVDRVSALGGSPALYLYGSVATGMARVGRSDVDLFTVGLPPAAAALIGHDLGAAFAHLCRGVEIGPAQWADYQGPSDQAYGNRLFLRHYSVHLAGPALAAGWPAFAADAAAARGLHGDIGLCADRWRAELLRDAGPSLLGRRVARKTLLAVAGLVSLHDALWTTDRVAAAWRWGVLRPALAGALQQLVGWCSAGPPGPPPSAVQAALDGVVAEVVDAFRQRVGLWR